MEQVAQLKQVLAMKNVTADTDLLQRAVNMPNYDLNISQWRYPKHGEYLASNPLKKKKKSKKGKKKGRGASKSPKKKSRSKSPKSSKKKIRAASSSSGGKSPTISF